MAHGIGETYKSPMEWLNYHHLFYFWTTVREGGVLRASQKLRLTQPTVSEQLRSLEDAFGEKLFHRAGRRLVLTDVGQLVYRYADEIFSLGRELQDAVKGRVTGRPMKLTVGLTEAMPKLIAYRLLEPALRMPEHAQIVCYEGRPERLLADLAVHSLDLVLSDSPAEPGTRVRVYSHLLGECGVTFFSTRKLAAAHKAGFPKSLDGAPMLLPTANTSLRRSLAHWFDTQDVRPAVTGEFQDSALLAVFGQQGVGIFPAPSAIEDEVTTQYGVEVVGRVDALRERFYAISAERRLKHPAVLLISQTARAEIFRR